MKESHIPELRAIATAAIADDVVTNEEILQLHRWLEARDPLPGSPAARLRADIQQICSDGIVTSAERRHLLRVLKQVSTLMTRQEKGEAFEKFIISRFDPAIYRLIEWRSDKYLPGWGFPMSSMWPDIEMQNRRTRKRFAIECKFRARPTGDALEWASESNIRHYNVYAETRHQPVIIAIGVGGSPDAPGDVYLVNLRRLPRPICHLQELVPYRIADSVTQLEYE